MQKLHDQTALGDPQNSGPCLHVLNYYQAGSKHTVYHFFLTQRQQPLVQHGVYEHQYNQQSQVRKCKVQDAANQQRSGPRHALALANTE